MRQDATCLFWPFRTATRSIEQTEVPVSEPRAGFRHLHIQKICRIKQIWWSAGLVPGDLAFILQQCARKTDAPLCEPYGSDMRKFRQTTGDAVLGGISEIDKSVNVNRRLTRSDPIGMHIVGDCVLQQQHVGKGSTQRPATVTCVGGKDNCLSRGIKAFQLYIGAGIRIHHPPAFGHPLYRKGERCWR